MILQDCIKVERVDQSSALCLTVLYFLFIGATAAPIELKCNHVTAVSVEIEWVPGNSSYAHAIYLNGKEIQIVKPSIVNYLLQNLTPDTDYEVLIQARLAKEIKKIPRKSEEVSTRTSFRTLVGGELS